ncbi:HAD family hydrolase [Oerskovia sp. M15]
MVPFSAHTRMSGIDLPLPDGRVRRIRKGAGSAVERWVSSTGTPTSSGPGGTVAQQLAAHVDAVSSSGGTPLVVAEQVGEGPARVLGVVHLKDVVKEGMRERFDELRAMGIRTVMVTGDNAVTARAIAAEAGVDDVLAEATPRTSSRSSGASRPAGGSSPWPVTAPTTPRPGAGRRGRRDEHRDHRRQGGGEHGGPRLRPDQAHRDRRDRQAAPHHARGTDDVLDRQRHREVLRDPARDVHGRVPAARGAQRHAPVEPRVGHPVGRRLQRAHHPGAHPAVVAGCGTGPRQRPRCCAATSWSTASAASRPRSSGSSSSTS